MIVDADPDIRGLVKGILEGAGVLCVMGDDPMEAVKLARLNRPDVVLLDIGLSLEGIGATHAIKAERPETKVVLLTGHDEDAFLSATGKTGADALLPKKELRTDLLPVLRAVIGSTFVGIWDGSERRRGLPGGPRRGRERRRAVVDQVARMKGTS